MKIFFISFILGIMGSVHLFANADSTHFGTVSLQINDGAAQTYFARNATLYRNVALSYDKSLQIQSEDLRQQFFYVQLTEGTHYVLHLILDAAATLDSGLTYSYDVYFDLGNTLNESVSYDGVDSLAFVFPNGEFTRGMRYAKNQTGQFNIRSEANQYGVAGTFSTEFEYPLTIGANVFDRISLSGTLRIPEANLRQGGPGGISQVASRKSNLGRNLLLSAILTAVLAATVLLTK